MAEITKENSISLEEGVDYTATITITSRAGSNEVHVTTTRGPESYNDAIEALDDEAYIEVPASWQICERMLEPLAQMRRDHRANLQLVREIDGEDEDRLQTAVDLKGSVH